MRGRLSRLAFVGVLAACGGSPSPAPVLEGHAATATPAPRTTAAPAIKWIDNGFDADGLPAAARDGSVVVLAIRDPDGGRGNPNLRLVVKDRRDATLEQIPVLGVDEVDAMFDAHGVTPALRARIDAANQRLAALHAQHDLVPLAGLDVDTAAAPEERVRATGEGLTVEWKASHLVIADRGRPVVTTTTSPSWLVQDRPMCSTCAEICHNAAFLGGVVGDAARRLVVLTVSYTGTDTCWEPASQDHVISW